MKILYYCPFASGGIVDYARTQAAALVDAGADITLLTVQEVHAPEQSPCPVLPLLEDETRPLPNAARLFRRIHRSVVISRNIARLRKYITHHEIRHVLFASYAEYAAPFWGRHLTKLSRDGFCFAAILHDPFRNHVVGPPWWHRWSIRSGYSFLSDVFVHEPIDPVEAGIPAHVRVSVIPHGPLQFPAAGESRQEVRAQLGIPDEAKLLLSFGQIRDGKNLDLAIRSLKGYEQLWLLVAGKEAGGMQRPLGHYQAIA